MLKRKWFKFLLVSFICLTIIKLFTAKVGLLGDPTEQLVIKPYPTIFNEYYMKGEENEANILKYKGTWYFEGKYYTITGDEAGFNGEKVYDFMMHVWWMLGAGIILVMVSDNINKRRQYKLA
ncbi:hypothetical protein [Acetivibrio cellulolyticus]|uniref:hypothetical protein n=1 Tax=Acetivibrio cellulolyticus TaxID=35830 RepID=UPI0001E2F14C|nr:hypothetical protein [Acetivibrio cellulolyticus]